MQRLIKWFIPKEEKFFHMLKAQSENALNGVKELKKLVFQYSKLSAEEKKEIVRHIKELEHKGDDIAHNLIKDLDASFITPLDKEDIHRLCGLLDDIADHTDRIARRLVLFNIENIDNFVKNMAEILVDAVSEVDKAILHLKKLQNMDDFYIKIHSLENQSDKIFHTALSTLFRDNKDPVNIIKLKDIYQILEGTIDKCEDIASRIESIVIKHA
ncbi:DUF47 family protein [Candidatus Woesearchaeota archaeon]|nr:DUF47 family protein [Candidatus Woesearchaeota archaeon]